jgi:hypothetical protein
MSVLLFFHILAATVAVGALTAAAVAAGAGLWELVRWAAVATIVSVLVAIGLGEGLAADEHASATWLAVGRGLTVFGLLLGAAGLAVASGVARTRPGLRAAVTLGAVVLVALGLAVAFVMAAKPA